jgi:polysaccharide pyruvyl transferase WcaK-like protein
MNKILFSGYYGHDNFGDDMFVLISNLSSIKFWKNTNTKFFSKNGPEIDSVKINYTLPSKNKFKGYIKLKSYLEILKCDIFILSGGSILHTKPNFFDPMRAVYFLSYLNLLKIGAIGISIGPFKTKEDEEYIQKILKNFKFLGLRDKNSFNFVNKLDLKCKPFLASDLAFTLPSVSEKKNDSTDNKEMIIGISLCHFETYSNGDLSNEKNREEKIYKVLLSLSTNKNIKFRFFIINGNKKNGDSQITYEFIDKLDLDKNNYEVIEYSKNPIQIYNKIKECKMMLTIRLHGAIFSAVANIPSLLIEYHRKCSDYLDDIGIDKYWRIYDATVDEEEIIQKINQLLKNKYEEFYPKRNELIRLSEKNFLDPSVIKVINGK